MDWETLWAKYTFSSVWSLSCVRLFVTPGTASLQDSLPITSSQSFLKLMSIKLLMPSNYLILFHLLLFPSVFPSIRVCSKESVLLFLLVFHITEWQGTLIVLLQTIFFSKNICYRKPWEIEIKDPSKTEAVLFHDQNNIDNISVQDKFWAGFPVEHCKIRC